MKPANTQDIQPVNASFADLMGSTADASTRESLVCLSMHGSFWTTAFTVDYQGWLASDWRLAKPIKVTIERTEDGLYLVSDDLFMVYGVGETLREALQDYSHSLVELYELTEESALNNACDSAILNALKEYVVRRQCDCEPIPSYFYNRPAFAISA